MCGGNRIHKELLQNIWASCHYHHPACCVHCWTRASLKNTDCLSATRLGGLSFPFCQFLVATPIFCSSTCRYALSPNSPSRSSCIWVRPRQYLILITRYCLTWHLFRHLFSYCYYTIADVLGIPVINSIIVQCHCVQSAIAAILSAFDTLLFFILFRVHSISFVDTSGLLISGLWSSWINDCLGWKFFISIFQYPWFRRRTLFFTYFFIDKFMAIATQNADWYIFIKQS